MAEWPRPGLIESLDGDHVLRVGFNSAYNRLSRFALHAFESERYVGVELFVTDAVAENLAVLMIFGNGL